MDFYLWQEKCTVKIFIKNENGHVDFPSFEICREKNIFTDFDLFTIFMHLVFMLSRRSEGVPHINNEGGHGCHLLPWLI